MITTKEIILSRRATRNRFIRILRVWLLGRIGLGKRMKRYYFIQQYSPIAKAYLERLKEKYGIDPSVDSFFRDVTHYSETKTFSGQ